MPHKFWKQISYISGLLAIAVLFGLIVFAANVEIKDLDLWLHLKMGEFIFQHHYVPDVDVLSHTIAGKPWVNHEWLFQLICYGVFNAWGPDGLISMQVFVVAFTFLILLFLGYNKEKQFGMAFLLLLVLLVYQMRFTIRPDIFSLLFFASYIYILALHIDKKWSIIVLGIIQVLWANFHGFFFFGPFIVLMGICAEWIKRRVPLPYQWNEAGRLTDDEFGRLKFIFVAVILASLVNPLTFKGAWYPIDVLINIPGKSKVFFSYIQELKPPITRDNIFSFDSYGYYKLLIVISFVGFVFNRKKIDIGDFFIWMLFLLVSLGALRNIVFFSFAAYFVCMTNYGNLSSRDIIPVHFKDKKFELITLSLLKILLVVWMIQFMTRLSTAGYFDFDKYELKSEFGGVTQRNYPNKAADFLIANEVKGNFFNDFNSGAYLIGRCHPNIKVFIDGRTEVYGPEFFRYYQKIWGEANTEIFEEAVKRYNITGVLLNTIHENAPPKLLLHIYQNKDWVPVYFDYDAVIFLKNVPQNAAVIQKCRLDLSKWAAPKMDLQKLGPRLITPIQQINRAYSLEAMNLDDLALEEAREVLKILPQSVGAHKIMGKIYGKRNDYRKAFEYFRIAAMLSSQDDEIRSNLALAYEKIGDIEHAIKQYVWVSKAKPKDAKAYFKLAGLYAHGGQLNEIVPVLKKGLQLDTSAVRDTLEIGDMIFKKEKFELARQVYETALLGNRDSDKVYHKIGLCYQSLGFRDKAKAAFEVGLAKNPKNEELKESLSDLGKIHPPK